MTTIALAGNPNCGKTTLFNVLTGTHQRVGNWPGVTVEQKSGYFEHLSKRIEVIDLPGTYSLETHDVEAGLDEQIAVEYLNSGQADVVVNVIDAAALSRGLYLTNQLLNMGLPTVVAINMLDVAQANGMEIDIPALSRALDCPVIPLVASKQQGVNELITSLSEARSGSPIHASVADSQNEAAIYAAIDVLLTDSVTEQPPKTSITARIDKIVLHPVLAFPIFLGVLYLMFLISINVGSAFIDFFDLMGTALFVEAPRQLFEGIGLPNWLTIFLADGVGGGVQLVGTFIPVIGALFLVLSVLEDSGYMARVAFIVDRGLRSLGLPGKAFVPLIVGFGCNVPAVMATRALDSQPDRILTTLMAPYMSCGARLTVYALFAAAFFPSNGQNIVFGLYLIGIVIAVLSALAVKRYLLPETHSHFVLELPPYHLPVLRNTLMQTWQRLKGFVLRAGKAIVLVVICLNVLNSLGTDGSVGNENTEKSVLSNIGKSITPLFSPMGIEEDNWPATVGIFTGIFAKEVVVGTLDALYSLGADNDDSSLTDLMSDAFASIPANLADLAGQLSDPLGLDLGDLNDLNSQAEQQAVNMSTIGAMQTLFPGQLAAFAYLLFILLYMPCVATIGVIFKEVGSFWAAFSVLWSVTVAYAAAVSVYQLGHLSTAPGTALLWLGIAGLAVFGVFRGLVYWGRRSPAAQLIPVKLVE